MYALSCEDAVPGNKIRQIQAHALHVSLRDTDVAAQVRIHRLRMTLKVCIRSFCCSLLPQEATEIRA